MKNFTDKHYQQNAMTILFIIIGMAATIALEFYLPAIPMMAHHFKAPISTLQWTISIFVLGLGFGQLLSGTLADCFGRYPVLIAGTLIFTLASLICGLIDNTTYLIIARLIQGIGSAACIVTYRVIIADTHDKTLSANKINSSMGIVLIGIAAGPAIGGYVAHYFGWRMCFYVMAAYGLILFLSSLLWIRETHKHKNPQAIHPAILFKNWRTLLTSNRYLTLIVTIILAFSMFYTFITEAPVLFVHLFHSSAKAMGWYVVVVMIGFVVGIQLSKYLVKKLSLSTVIKSGIIICILASISGLILHVCIGDSIALLVADIALVFFGMSLIYGNCLAAAYKLFPQMIGTTASLSGFLQYLGTFAFSSLIVALPSPSLVTLFTLNAITSVCLLVYFIQPRLKTMTVMDAQP